MDITRIVGACLIASILIVLVRAQRPEIAVALSIIVGVSVFMYMMSHIAYLVSTVAQLALRARMGNIYLASVLKAVGIAYVAGFAAEVSRDAGEQAIASKIEFAGKVAIMVVALPVMVAILETVMRFLD
ncbi:MAG TPA: stage III sporulation protein AD [Firmicutes bacterium]|nr:stage III sporulation protein AD [Bacillota bacterium]